MKKEILLAKRKEELHTLWLFENKFFNVNLQDTVFIELSRLYDWSLVLLSMGIEHRLEKVEMGWSIVVVEEYRKLAEYEIMIYEIENSGAVKQVQPKIEGYSVNRKSLFLVLLLISLFHVFVYNVTDPSGLIEIGAASASKILFGELWRTVTALTLHSDFSHLLSNMIFGGAALWALSYYTGSGIGWFLVLVSGIYGNFINAVVHQSGHLAIGSSTAVFGALGILTGIQLCGLYRQKIYKIWIPPAGAVALFALLGVGGANTDVGAHLFGFVVGGVLGVMTGLFMSYYHHPGRKVQLVLSVVTVFIVLFSWLLAILKYADQYRLFK